jgi:serine/threonine-protein kinase
MPIVSAAQLVETLRRYQILEPSQLQEVVQQLQPRLEDAQALGRELRKRGWLTAYQYNLLLQGHGRNLMLGGYVLLEPLGAGGMGQVFKARHPKLGRYAALKVIRKDFLAHPDAVRRFQREVQAAAQLCHPHVVMAYDAGQSGSTHFYAMEFVDGIDLARLVKRGGPLPVAQACEFIRQAALGLQHAHERGMVHRDIKPSNLFLSAHGSVIKILDMGVARMHQSDKEEGSGPLTRHGLLVGTVDYIAPEQALDAHSADIRADLYSLGCTLYYLLAGHVPFPGGTATEKLWKHQTEEARPLEQSRPDVPPRVADIVRKLMAKEPAARYQSPAELANALADVALSADQRSHATAQEGRPAREEATIAHVDVSRMVDFANVPGSPGSPEPEDPFAGLALGVARDTLPALHSVRRSPPGADRRLVLFWGVSGALLLAGMAIVLFFLAR